MSLFQKPMIVIAFIFSLLFVNPIVLVAQTTSKQSRTNIYELQVGTKIRLQMDNEINSKSSSVNDTFTAKVVKPIVVDGVTILPVDVIVEGRVIDVRSAASAGKGGKLEVRFEKLRFKNGLTRNIDAVLVNPLKSKSAGSKNALTVIGGTIIGALIGVFAKSDSGALIGASLGAGVGTGTVLIRKGKEVRIKADKKFEIELKKKVTLPAEGF